jgi:hypothetical protein
VGAYGQTLTGKSILLKHVCDRGYAQSSSEMPFRVKAHIRPSLACRDLNPWTGNREEPVENCKRRARWG